MQMFRRRATEEELAAGREEMLKEQERLAREAVEQRTEDHGQEERQTQDPEKKDPPPTPYPTVQSIATPSQETPQGGRNPGETRELEYHGMMTCDGNPAETGGWVTGGAGAQSPLFNEEQLRRIAELQRAAPMLMGRPTELERPTWLVEEERKRTEAEVEKERQEGLRERQRVFQRLNDQEKLDMLDRIKVLEEEVQKILKEAGESKKEADRLKKENGDLREVNQKVAEELRKMRDQERRSREEFGTPAEGEEGFPERPKEEIPGVSTPRRDDPRVGEEKKDSPIDSRMMLKGMMKLMEGMQVMQTQLLDVKKESGLEVVRGGASELPRLQEWRAETAPLDLTDWLLTIGPAMGDLSNGSQQWWEATLAAARDWYTKHQEKPPLEKVTHRPEVPLELKEPRYQRLEKRATALLMAAIPQTQQEEVIAGKEVSTLAVLSRLMTSYQPGGLSEKAAILSALDSPEEAQTLPQAVTGLRRWLRWHRRAGEVNVVRPDATIQVKGLGKLMRKVLKDHQDLAFRIQLAKTTLAIDTTPTEATVMTYANHLLAEVEQVAHQDKKKSEKPQPAPVTDPKMKKFEEKGWEGKGTSKSGEPRGGGGITCRFFLTEAGCKKGKGCSYQHQLDDQKRCWNCGSTQDFAPKCDRPREAGIQKGEPKGEGKQAKSLRKEDSPSKEEPTSSREDPSNEVMKGLLEEANKMLKSMSTPKVEERDGKIDKLQKQLDELKCLKVFRLSRMEADGQEGLLDSGATHALRGKRRREDLRHLREIQVSLACGKKVPLKMTKGGTMVSPAQEVEPIVPLGRLVKVLGCTLEWDQEGGMVLNHPQRGAIRTRDRGGCPHIPKDMALQLIEELEGATPAGDEGLVEAKKIEDERREEEVWIKDFVKTHPVLSQLPPHIQDELIKVPSQSTTGLPGVNKRRRKKWAKHGVTLHLYSGPDEGFTLSRALQEAGGDEALILEVDLKNGKEWDMIGEGVYEVLLRLALNDEVRGVVCGPNCRTRSILRRIPIPGNPRAPRPVREWGGGEWGREDMTREEMKKVHEDDIMLWRAITIELVAIHVGRAQRPGEEDPRFLVEQPAEDERYPETVALWRTEEWKRLKRQYGWKEVTFRQGDLGGKSSKPTTVGGDLLLQAPEKTETRVAGGVKSSKDLERWAPGMMREIARQIVRMIQKKKIQAKALSWDEHVQLGHVHFRRDCRICQETRQKQNPHRRVGAPLCGVLSLDTAGPFKEGHDLVMKSRYLMVGAFTWMVPKGTKGLQEVEKEMSEEAPQVEEWKDNRKKLEEDEAERSPREGPHRGELEEDEAERSPREGPHRGEHEEAEEERPPEQKPQEEERLSEEELKNWEVRVFRMAAPLATKRTEETLRMAIEFVLRLKADGYQVNQIHTDQGHEYYGQFREWCDRRGILLTRTPGDDPQGNGRAEVAIQGVTRQIRATLHQAGKGWEWWPMAARHAAEILRYARIEKKVDVPPFMEEVLVRRRHWRRGVLMEPSTEKVRYICPAWDHHGHWVLKEDGTKIVTRYVIRRLAEPITEGVWVALEEETLDALQARRRMREKTSPVIRKIQESGPEGTPEEPEEMKKRREDEVIARVIEEEMMKMVEEEIGLVREEFQVLTSLRKMIDRPWEEEEVLQTKIVSPYEVQKNWSAWKEAAQDEIRSLLEEKEALEEISKERVEEMRREAEEEGRHLEVIPSKVVFTRKPGPCGGKPKVRWVVCGNFEVKKPEEDNFSSGADATAFRVMIHEAVQNQWVGSTIDVKTAFLNAEWKDGEEALMVVKPPAILTEVGALRRNSYFIPKKAVYGFRRSPRLWGEHRDKMMDMMEIQVGGEKKEVLMLQPMESEPNLWKVVAKEGDIRERPAVMGLVMTYVDDMFIVGGEEVVRSVTDTLRKCWKTSDPEEVNRERPVRFLGMEVYTEENEETGYEDWIVCQSAYVQDMLSKTNPREKKIPITRDQATELLIPEEEPGISEVREAQKVVGELLWTLTRTRPDLMFSMSRLCSQVLRAPRKVIEVANQVKGYLKRTVGEGLRFKKSREGEEKELRVYTDASFAPDGGESHGCVVVKLGESLLAWKSSRQTMVTLSTAESELVEVVEGFALGEATAVVVEEIEGEIRRMGYTDSQSALAILSGDGGSWRTRHLRMRASYARQLIQKGVWTLQHMAGEKMLADLGTKALASPRMTMLKEELGMASKEPRTPTPREEEEGEKDQENQILLSTEEIQKALRMVLLMAHFQVARGQGGEDDERLRMEIFVVAMLSLIGLMTMCGWLWRMMGRRRLTNQQPEEEQDPRGVGREEGGDREDRVRRRGMRGQEGMRSPATPSSHGPASTHQTPESRTSSLADEFVEHVRRSMLGTPRGEPGGEPGTFLEDFTSGATIFEGYTHPDTWDPEVDGEIHLGKGEPPRRFFEERRMKGLMKGEEKGKEKGKGYAFHGGGSEPGSSSNLPPVPPFPNLQGRRSDGEPPRREEGGKGEEGKGNGGSGGNQGGPSQPGTGEGPVSPPPVYLTPYGTKYHASPGCRSLRKSRNMRRSDWCPDCVRNAPNDGMMAWVYSQGPGRDVHTNMLCMGAQGGTRYDRCGLCVR